MTPKEKLEKELHRLQRELNSPRLATYIEGDQSEEELSRQRERASKLARFNEILSVLHKANYRIQNSDGTFHNAGTGLDSWFSLENAKKTVDYEAGQRIVEHDGVNVLWEVL